jgi:alpha-tubulin suppressor-like RCC1 family protein
MVSVANDFVVVIRATGQVHAWGSNAYGQLDVPLDLGTDVQQVSAGDGFVVVVKADGTVRAWGRNDKGQTDVPQGLSNVLCVSAGSGFAVALTRDGELVSWGARASGPLSIPVDVNEKKVLAVSCLGNRIVFVTEDAAVTQIVD